MLLLISLSSQSVPCPLQRGPFVDVWMPRLRALPIFVRSVGLALLMQHYSSTDLGCTLSELVGVIISIIFRVVIINAFGFFVRVVIGAALRPACIGPLRLAFFAVYEFVPVSAGNGTAELWALLCFGMLN